MEPRFVPFGPDHVAAVGLPIAGGLVLAWLVRARPEGREALGVRVGLAGLILVLIAFVLVKAFRGGWLTLELLPLHLCDMALLLSVYALVARSQVVAEVLWFWAGAGTILAMLTPDVGFGFPDWRFLVFFGLHGLVVMTTLVLVFGFSLRPRPGSARRVFLLTAAYTGAVGAMNAVLGTNFMFLCRKPPHPTLLDAFGPWPIYVGVAALCSDCCSSSCSSFPSGPRGAPEWTRRPTDCSEGSSARRASAARWDDARSSGARSARCCPTWTW